MSRDEQVIARYRMARAHRLVDVIRSLPAPGGGRGTPAQHLELAQALTPAQWDEMVGFLDDVHQQDLAEQAAQQGQDPGLEFVPFAEREPSDVTIAMAIDLLERAAAADADPFRGFPTYT